MSIRVLLYGANAGGDSRAAGSLTAQTESFEMTTWPAMKLARMLLSLIPLVRTHRSSPETGPRGLGRRGRIRHRRPFRSRGSKVEES